MTSRSEQAYLRHYGKDVYTGVGEVVDLGCFLGSLTLPLAEGLASNANFAGTGRKVRAYDTFRWITAMEMAVAGTALAGRFNVDDRFLDAFRSNVFPFESFIEAREGDLTLAKWSGEPIEFLVVDAMKSWELANAILREFYFALEVGKSLVMHQDFAHFYTPWIHLLHWRFRDHFLVEHEVPRAGSLVFRYVNELSSEQLNKDYSFADFPDDEIDEAFDFSLSIVSDAKRPNIYSAKIMAYFHQDRLDDAQACLDLAIRSVGFQQDLVIVSEILDRQRTATSGSAG